MKTYLINLFSTWGGLLSNIVVAIFLTPTVIRELGEARYGIWALMINLVGYYGLLDIGFRSGATKYLAEAVAKNSKAEGTEIISSAFFSMAFLGVLILALTIPVAFNAEHLISIDKTDNNEVFWCILIMGFGVGIQFPFTVFGSSLVANERYDVANIVGAVIRAAHGISAIIALRFGYGLTSLAILLMASNTLEYFIKMIWSFRISPDFCLSLSSYRFKTARSLLSFGVWTGVGDKAGKIANYSDTVIIASLMPTAFIAPYALASSIGVYVGRLIMPLTQVFFPRAVKMAVKQDFPSIKNSYLTSGRLILAISIAIAATAAVYFEDFINVWLGDAITEATATQSKNIFMILSITFVLISWQRIGRQFILAFDRHKSIGILSAGEALLNIIVSIILCHLYGTLGVAIGTLISSTIFNLFIYPPCAARVVRVRVRDFFYASLPRTLILTPILVGSLCGLRVAFDEIESWTQLGMHGFCAALISSTLVYLIAFTANDKAICRDRLLELLRRINYQNLSRPE